MTEEKIYHVIRGLDAWNSGDFEKLLEKTDGNYSELVKAHTFEKVRKASGIIPHGGAEDEE
ncbi:MAG: hypothetical protein KGH55_03570 [Nanoarchaeota archaeon]|nr:hypothetical protein [Nanoarchaeota archaeon]